MPPQRMKDFLDATADFHKELGDFYETSSAGAKDEEIRILLEYIGHHERALEKIVREYESDSSKAVLETWFKVSPACAGFPHPELLALSEDMSAGDIIDRALQLDDALVCVYEELARQAESQDVRAVANDLLDQEKRERIRLLRSKLVD